MSSNTSVALSVCPVPSPFGVGLTDGDRVQAVAQWNLAAGNIADQEAIVRERSRAVREAGEAASGIKGPLPIHPSLVESFNKMDVNSKAGKTASLAPRLTETSGLAQDTPPVGDTVPNPSATSTSIPTFASTLPPYPRLTIGGCDKILKGPASCAPNYLISADLKIGYASLEPLWTNHSESGR